MKIVAGIVHYRFWPTVAQTIDMVQGQSRPPDELFVYDHASGDGSAERIRERYPQVEVIEAEVNRGPIPGANAVLRELCARDADAVLFLTHNARLSERTLEHLEARLEANPAAGAVGPLIGYIDDPERVYFGGGYFDPRTWDVELRHEPARMAEWDGQPPQEADWLEFAGLLMRSEAARATGELFEGFYYHYDDSEYTARMRGLGWTLELVPQARAWKQPGARPTYLEVRNRLGFIARVAPRRILVRELLRSLYYLVRQVISPPVGVSRRHELRHRGRGVADFLRGRWGAPPASVQSGGGGGRYG